MSIFNLTVNNSVFFLHSLINPLILKRLWVIIRLCLREPNIQFINLLVYINFLSYSSEIGRRKNKSICRFETLPGIQGLTIYEHSFLQFPVGVGLFPFE